MSKRKRARDECSICKANGTNAIGHLAQWCSYKDGPFEGNFKGAIKAKKESEKRAKKVKGLGLSPPTQYVRVPPMLVPRTGWPFSTRVYGGVSYRLGGWGIFFGGSVS